MKFTIMFPSVFGEISSPWDKEYEIAKKVGFNVALFDEETFITKNDLKEQVVIYRGWMISPDTYEKIIKMVEKKKGVMLIPLEQFRKVNSLSLWYPLLQRETIESFLIKDFSTLGNYFKNNELYFVKDELKSLGGYNSFASSEKEAMEIYNRIQNNRDFSIQNNIIVLRTVVDISNEERYFCFNGEVLGEHSNKERLSFVQKVISKLKNKLGILFVSIDVGTVNNKDILIEIGGFQVSDIDKDGNEKRIVDFYVSLLKSLS